MFRLALSASLSALACASSASPVNKVITLLNDLASRAEADGRKEQQLYDRSACWCEETMARKVKDVNSAKAEIEQLSASILELEGQTATHKAEVVQLEKDLAANQASQKEASDVRASGKAAYDGTKVESEQAIGALEAAVKAIAGAGEGRKSKFLETGKSVPTLQSAASSLRSILRQPTTMAMLSAADMHTVERFVDQPQAFVQVGSNPFGDYAPQSTQIQGILKGLYDGFTASLEKANVEEAETQKAHQEFMATKLNEEQTLQSTLQKQSLDSAEKSKKLADSKVQRDATIDKLAEDEEVFQTTKKACQSKAENWNERARLRTEELRGMQQAVKILTSPGASAIFEKSSTTFLQLRAVSVHKHLIGAANAGAAAAARLRLAAKEIRVAHLRAATLLELAAEAEVGGHFDAVIVSIDKMIEVLRAEEAADIAHRDRCEGTTNKNGNDMEDLTHNIEKATSMLERLSDKMSAAREWQNEIAVQINATVNDLQDALGLRNAGQANFKQALKDDMDAIELLDKAIVTLSEFYKRNNISLAFVQQEPTYTVDKDKMVDSFDGAYGGRKSETTPVIALLATIKEDLEKEIVTTRQAEALEQSEYEAERLAMTSMLESLKKTMLEADQAFANLQSAFTDASVFKDQQDTSLSQKEDLQSALMQDCSWVKTHFDARRADRKAELAGLVEAKGFLAGAAADVPENSE